jgi:hypothetical protein
MLQPGRLQGARGETERVLRFRIMHSGFQWLTGSKTTERSSRDSSLSTPTACAQRTTGVRATAWSAKFAKRKAASWASSFTSRDARRKRNGKNHEMPICDQHETIAPSQIERQEYYYCQVTEIVTKQLWASRCGGDCGGGFRLRCFFCHPQRHPQNTRFSRISKYLGSPS